MTSPIMVQGLIDVGPTASPSTIATTRATRVARVTTPTRREDEEAATVWSVPEARVVQGSENRRGDLLREGAEQEAPL